MWPRAAKSPHGKVYPGSSQGTGRVCSWGFGVGLSLGRAEKHSCNSLCERPRARGSRKAVCQGPGKRLQPLQGFAARPPRHTGSPTSSSPAQGSLAAATRLREAEMDRSCSGVRCHIHLHRPSLQHISLSFPDPRPPPTCRCQCEVLHRHVGHRHCQTPSPWLALASGVCTTFASHARGHGARARTGTKGKGLLPSKPGTSSVDSSVLP